MSASTYTPAEIALADALWSVGYTAHREARIAAKLYVSNPPQQFLALDEHQQAGWIAIARFVLARDTLLAAADPKGGAR